MSLPLSPCQDVCHTRWHSDERLAFALFCPFSLLCWFLHFSCTKYYWLVWSAYRRRNFIRIQHYFSHSSLFVLVMSLITSYGLRLSLSSLLMLWQKALFLLLQKYLRVRCFISWLEEFQNAFILRFECILPFLIVVMMSPIAGYLVLCHLSQCHFYWISFLLLTFPAKKFRS